MQGSFNGNPVGSLPPEERKVLGNPREVTWEQVEAVLKKEEVGFYGGKEANDRASMFGAYMLSKACLTAYVFSVARDNPGVLCTCVFLPCRQFSFLVSFSCLR